LLFTLYSISYNITKIKSNLTKNKNIKEAKKVNLIHTQYAIFFYFFIQFAIYCSKIQSKLAKNRWIKEVKQVSLISEHVRLT